jgi:hypothetical protein
MPYGFPVVVSEAHDPHPDGRIELVVEAEGGETVLLSHDAICLADVRREELVQPDLHAS